MISLLQFGLCEGVSCRGRPDASFSQADTWKKLISRYIQAMPSIGSRPEAGEQMVIWGASLAAIHAISAKVGEAAMPSQPAAPLARALLFLVAMDVVIVGLPIDFRRFQPLQNRTET